jgi:hypothetical protein
MKRDDATVVYFQPDELEYGFTQFRDMCIRFQSLDIQLALALAAEPTVFLPDWPRIIFPVP